MNVSPESLRSACDSNWRRCLVLVAQIAASLILDCECRLVLPRPLWRRVKRQLRLAEAMVRRLIFLEASQLVRLGRVDPGISGSTGARRAGPVPANRCKSTVVPFDFAEPLPRLCTPSRSRIVPLGPRIWSPGMAWISLADLAPAVPETVDGERLKGRLAAIRRVTARRTHHASRLARAWLSRVRPGRQRPVWRLLRRARRDDGLFYGALSYVHGLACALPLPAD